jgi:hypothetical protein
MLNTSTTFASTYNPLMSSNSAINNISYDKLNKFTENDVPSIMRGKEEVAPEFLFNTY